MFYHALNVNPSIERLAAAREVLHLHGAAKMGQVWSAEEKHKEDGCANTARLFEGLFI